VAGIVYFAHSYRTEDTQIVDYFARLIEANGLLLSLDPPSDRVNTAKLERHLLHSDAMVVVLTEREPSVSPHLLYEMSLAMRLDKPLLVFVEDTLPPTIVPPRVLQYRFSRKSFPRAVREHRQALRILGEQVGVHPPPSHRAPRGRRGCLVVGSSDPVVHEFLDRERRYDVLAAERFLKSIGEHPIGYDALAVVGLVVAFVGGALSPGDHYLLGLADSSRPTIRLSLDPLPFKTNSVPSEYRPRFVPASSDVREILGVELDIFEEDFLNLEDEAKTQRYIGALVDLGGPTPIGRYGQFTRDRVIEVVHGDRYDVRGSVGALGPNAHAHNVEMIQIWEQNRQQLDLAGLAEELGRLLPAMRSTSTSPQDNQAIVELGQAQQQARAGNGPAVMNTFGPLGAGPWRPPVPSAPRSPRPRSKSLWVSVASALTTKCPPCCRMGTPSSGVADTLTHWLCPPGEELVSRDQRARGVLQVAWPAGAGRGRDPARVPGQAVVLRRRVQRGRRSGCGPCWPVRLRWARERQAPRCRRDRTRGHFAHAAKRRGRSCVFVSWLLGDIRAAETPGIDPDLEDRKAADEVEIQAAEVSLVPGDPCEVVHVAGGGGAVEPGDLFGEILLHPYHLLRRKWRGPVCGMHWHRDPPSADRVEPDRR